ncbi:MAG: hypothetical protein CMB99_06805 [Flavobacteriaceae bacterium]|nr:hypothetical protein [Flavobacteriaceae bacterium]|tara:strand:+ start:74586 stop:75014 length:429 start_codon:yes stop_codon:yes gene_type:complete
MIFDTTLQNRENDILINDIVGHKFSFFESIRMKGVGSKRMIIESVSPNMDELMNKVSDINYANIELRKNGIIVHINQGLKTYSWVIPYHSLHTYQSNGYSIHADGKFVRFADNKLLKENKAFLVKMMYLRTENQEKYNFQLH